ncbi:MAG: hypothetical protein ABSB35_23045 [Bryobacteraceae bacterium]
MSPNLPAPRNDLSRGYRLLLMLGTLFAIVFLIFPIVLTPGVEPPAHLAFANALSMTVRISNQNPFTPLTDVEYSCEIWQVTLANGDEVTDANVLTRGSLQEFDGRRTIIAPCETAYVVNAPIKWAEYRLTLTYRAYPWHQYRSSVYHIAARIDENGHVTGWRLD